MQRLDATYSSVLQKLHELSGLAARLQGLGEIAKSTVQEFDAADARCRSEFRSQIRGIERFNDELGNIELLRERLVAQKERVREYHERLDKVQERIDRHKEMEVVWRRRASSNYPHPPRSSFFLMYQLVGRLISWGEERG